MPLLAYNNELRLPSKARNQFREKKAERSLLLVHELGEPRMLVLAAWHKVFSIPNRGRGTPEGGCILKKTGVKKPGSGPGFFVQNAL